MKLLNSLFIFLLPIWLFAQNGSLFIKDNVNIILKSNVNLIIDQPNTNGIIKSGSLLGGIISEGEQNRVIWNVNSSSGIYTIPFKYTNGNLIPLVANVSVPGVPATKGQLFFSTYHTDNLNTPYPNGFGYFNPVTNMWYEDFSDNSANVVDRFWILNFVNYTTKPTTLLTLTYDNSELNGLIPADLRAQYWSGTYWVNPPLGAADAPNRNVNLIDNVNFNAPWVVSNRLHVLPIELLSFDVKYNNKKIAIEWITASETNNSYFVVERSYNLSDWKIVGAATGAGNSNTLSYYFIYDNEIVYDKDIYYRLKQVDYDGNYSYSNIKFIIIKGFASELKIDKLYISSDILNVELSKKFSGKVDIIEIASGKILLSDIVINNNFLKIPVNNLKCGSYIIRLIGEGAASEKFKI